MEAAHLSGSVSLRESCCDILVSQPIYNFVCKCVVTLTVIFLFILFFANGCSFFLVVSLLCQLQLCGLSVLLCRASWCVWKVSASCCTCVSQLYFLFIPAVRTAVSIQTAFTSGFIFCSLHQMISVPPVLPSSGGKTKKLQHILG